MKLLNDIKQLAVKAAVAIKNAARRAWETTTALLRRLRTATAAKVTAAQNAAADWWQAKRTPIMSFVAAYALVLLFAIGVVIWTFSLERQVPEVKDWVDALFAGRLILPGWELTANRTASVPAVINLAPATVSANTPAPAPAFIN